MQLASQNCLIIRENPFESWPPGQLHEISGNENVPRVQFTQYSVVQTESRAEIAVNHTD